MIRFHKNTKTKDPEGHFHRLLILYLPLRNETSSFDQKYNGKDDKLKSKIEHYEGLSEELENIMADDQPPQHSWDTIAHHFEQEKADEDSLQVLDDESAHICPDQDMRPSEFCVKESAVQGAISVEFSNDFTPKNHYYSMVRTLNTKQCLLHDCIIDWCWNLKNETRTWKKNSTFLYLLGR